MGLFASLYALQGVALLATNAWLALGRATFLCSSHVAAGRVPIDLPVTLRSVVCVPLMPGFLCLGQEPIVAPVTPWWVWPAATNAWLIALLKGHGFLCLGRAPIIIVAPVTPWRVWLAATNAWLIALLKGQWPVVCPGIRVFAQ